MYEYEAEVLSVYDGDTIRLRLDLGLDTYAKHSVRLYGVDTPEVRGVEKPQGIQATAFTTAWLANNCIEKDGRPLVRVQTIKDRREKYGRYLVLVFATDGTNRCLNDDLIESGHAVVYNGGAR